MGRSLDADRMASGAEFNRLALDLFGAQFGSVPIFRQFCERRNVKPENIRHWFQVPALPTAAFKEFEVSSIPPVERTAVFYSSGTTQENRSRHFHHAQSLQVYEDSLLPWFERNFRPAASMKLVFLTPEVVPNSSLVHMFNVVRRRLGGADSTYMGRVNADGSWGIDMDGTVAALESNRPIGLLGTAFSFVHLLDYLEGAGKRIVLPRGSLSDGDRWL